MQWEVRGRLRIEEEDARAELAPRGVDGRRFGMDASQARLSVLKGFRRVGRTSQTRLSYDR